MLVELKSGETLNGHLLQCDTWMNITLKEVVQTSAVSCSAAQSTSSVVANGATFRTATSLCGYQRSM